MSAKRGDLGIDPRERAFIDALNDAYQPPPASRGFEERVMARVERRRLSPLLAFTAAAGLLTSWFDRKLTARVQMRKGPPLLQPFFDIAKLMIKETCVPAGGVT